MSTKTVLAKLTAFEGFLVFELLVNASSEKVTTSLDRPGSIGQVIHDTKNNLGVSPEALQLLRAIPKGHDSLGEVDWFNTSDGQQSFGWIGGPRTIKRAAEVEASRDYVIGEHVVIENDVPEGACAAIRELGNS